MSGALRLFPFAVFAAEAAGEGEDKAAGSLSLDELSLYTAPQHNFRHVEPEAGQMEEGVATVRKLAEPCTAWCQGAYSNVEPKVQKVVQFGNDTYSYLQNPPKDFYPRAGIIGFAGLLGLFLARGSRVKRVLYPVGFMAVGASLYYPEQAAAIAKSAGDCVYESAVKSYASVEKILNPQSKDGKQSESKP